MYRGYLQGETPRSIRAKMQPIAEFSELGDFLNMPVRYYSAGMMVRLAFSIATAIEPEILIIDEVLAAGDLAFQAKARERMRTLMSSARAVIVVSHDLASLPLLCDRVLWLDHGRMQMIGPAAEVIAAYTATSQPGACAKRVRTARSDAARSQRSCGSCTFHPFMPAATPSGRTSWCGPGWSGASSRCCG